MTLIRPNDGSVVALPDRHEKLGHGANSRPAAVPAWRIRAVIPCFNRRKDAELLLADLATLQLGSPARAELRVILVDNASSDPLDSIPSPAGLNLTHLRQESNPGGSGGFNAGLSRVLGGGVRGDRTELIWLLDSDVRIEPGALLPLLAVMESDPEVVAAGSALVDPASGQVFEVGGRIDRRSGEFIQPLPKGWEKSDFVESEYLAACSLMVRRTAVEQGGLMTNLFVNGDDVEWCLRLAQRTGGKLVSVPASRARHPHPDRMRTWARYYAARNAFFALDAAACGVGTRLGRALREVGRAVGQTMVGRNDLAELHLRGLADARAGVMGPAPAGAAAFEAWRKSEDLGPELKKILADRAPRGRVMIRAGVLAEPKAVLRALNAACVQPLLEREPEGGALMGLLTLARRMMFAPDWGIGIVSARGRLCDWLCARVIVTVAPEGFVVRRINRFRSAFDAVSVMFRGLRSAVSLAMHGHGASPRSGEAGVPLSIAKPASAPPLSVSAVVLSYNRRQAVEATLARLAEDDVLRTSQVIVADNASTDGTVAAVRALYGRVDVLESAENRGVASFNSGAARASGDLILLLDDDSWPDADALRRAIDVLAAEPELGAVALHPRHPQSRSSEWGFADRMSEPRRDWPVMGCGNLIRREVWERVRGYEESFFLYRNDTDLAMKILGAGYGVYFDPALVVWHDSPAAARKSPRWFRLATRNWVWVCRRHGRGFACFASGLLGAVWAHRLAGLSPVRHWQAMRGWLSGSFTKPPALPRGLRLDGAPIRTLLRLRLGR